MKVYEIFFSPTGGTKKAADAVAEEIVNNIDSSILEKVDLTDYNFDFSSLKIDKDDIAVIAVPAYAGRVPSTASKRILQIQGNNAKAVIICTYGNRAYDDTMIELYDIVSSLNFKIVSAAAAVARHSIAIKYASNRPDENDIKKLKEFAYNTIKASSFLDDNKLNGNRPYKKMSNVPLVPKTSSKCTNCKLCAKKCPVQAIDINNPKIIDKTKCISCMRCVHICHCSAKSVNKFMLFLVNLALKKTCSKAKDYEFYI
ncbi:4Fe-4S binding protein [Brachyspira murdochii]|uniref:4Fe-4S ferredoxin iron-sulfur binding domain protein n=1 Tax=Brachyspira murdochii (strain ATCC 51284 / DSM 12563 / 56-150) TaxID=526224 RepID=D5U627_BRAM5|nr:4Fe-4S binding protein [Brachyspira murdochii]ADG70518.1 4Fe-4S ferredoxin iron-sulfur binding domain protein [Brachyspira murdochii DSM 12563]